jgi:hypothetical protein
MEEWKEFEFGNKKYLVSSYGQFLDFETKDEIYQRTSTDGYRQVRLGEWRQRKFFASHRIVALLFVENKNPEEYVEVNHLDFDRKNNRAENLEWCTHRQNILYSCQAGRYGVNTKGENNPNFGNRKLSKIYAENLEYAKEKQGRPGNKNGRCVKVKIISLDKSFEKEFDYMRECADYMIENNMSSCTRDIISNHIALCISGKESSYSGYMFQAI